MIVIEMNPRVSRSSALASKATGFPIAKIAAKLAVGYTLDEVRNDITRETPASFEPTIDYVVVKVPRFTFEKFPQADPVLTTQMKSVGEAMAIGRTFKEALQKALRCLEIKRFGLIGDGADRVIDDDGLRTKLTVPNAERIFFLGLAFQRGWTVEEVFELTKIDRWFLENIREIVNAGDALSGRVGLPSERSSVVANAPTNVGKAATQDASLGGQDAHTARDISHRDLRRAKRLGFSDVQLAIAGNTTPQKIRAQRQAAGIIPTYRLVDTCAAEFEAYTPYYYSTYGDENERRDSGKKKVMILGGGPNRIGQGIEFDYCCVHAAFALKEEGFETIMVNSNPETVSTDYDTSDKLYFEPLTLEDVLNICEQESENLFGVIVQFGGQTPLNLARGLEEAGVPIIGTSPKSIEIAEDRKLFAAMLDKLGIRQTSGGTALSEDEAVAVAERIGYPVLVRPSFVLGGRAMQLVHDESDLRKYVRDAIEGGRDASSRSVAATPSSRESGGEGAAATQPDGGVASTPILVDHFLEDALEVDVDCICDGETVVIGAIMEHIEEAGIHSGDSACVIPPFSLKEEVKTEIAKATKAMARELNVRGLMNVQFAVKDDAVYVLEVNPRASRTAPFVSKAIGVPLPKLAAKIMAGKTLRELGFTREIVPKHFSVKEAVFPFIRFPGIDIMLGPEMKSTGEVMGIDEDLGLAYAKSQMAAQPALPTKGNVFISLADRQKPKSIDIARGFSALGFTLYATSGTAAALRKAGVPVKKLFKLNEGRPNALDMIKNGEFQLIINTPSGKVARADEIKIRSTATANRISTITTLRAARASLKGIRALRERGLHVKALQEYHAPRQEGV